MTFNPVICKNAENALCLFAVKTAAIFIKTTGIILSFFSLSNNSENPQSSNNNLSNFWYVVITQKNATFCQH